MMFYGALFATVRREELQRYGRTEVATIHGDEFIRMLMLKGLRNETSFIIQAIEDDSSAVTELVVDDVVKSGLC